MRSLYRNIIFLIQGVIILLASCEKDGIEPLFDQGVIRGTTYYYDETVYYGDRLPLNDVTVTVTGPYGSRTAVTDLNGKFEINNLGNGTYVIEYTKQGWGATKDYSVQVYGNDVLNFSHRMYKRPDFAMPLLVLKTEQPDEQFLSFRSDLSSEIPDIPDLRAFFSKTSDVNCVKYDYSSQTFFYDEVDGYIHYSFDKWHFSEEHGYIIIYVVAGEDQGEYDYNLGSVIFPSIDPQKHSEVFKF